MQKKNQTKQNKTKQSKSKHSAAYQRVNGGKSLERREQTI